MLNYYLPYLFCSGNKEACNIIDSSLFHLALMFGVKFVYFLYKF